MGTASAVTGQLPRAYLALNRRLSQIFQIVRGLVDGIWLGASSRSLLHGIDECFYASQPQYLAEQYTRSGLKDWERRALEEHFGACRNLVVTGAGGGREVLALAAEGRRVTGLEPNQGMVAFGRGLIGDREDVRLLWAPRDRWPAMEATFDGVIVGWGSYTHILGRRQRVAFLRDIRRHVSDGAPLLVSVYARPGTTLYHRIVHRVGSALKALRGGDPVELGDGFAPMYAHHFVRNELAAELREGGFTMVVWHAEPFAHAVAVAAEIPE